MRNCLLLIVCSMIFSCTSKNDLPEGILKPDKMQDVFWDFIRIDLYAKEYIKKDSNRNDTIENLKLQNKVFKLHNTTKEAFYKSYIYYSNHKELMTTMIDSMLARKKREVVKEKPVLKAL